MCGEACGIVVLTPPGPGPSPRGDRVRPGSIPACAGKPKPTAGSSGSFGVHPRVCGEACSHPRCLAVVVGPSPRVRGSLALRVDLRESWGSIPACAGKPRVRRWRTDGSRVHPRVCGEAVNTPMVASCVSGPSPRDPRVCGEAGLAFQSLRVVRGPSPRVRGSLRRLRLRPRRHGSIPACAGKPSPASTRASPRRVHPRVCGEAERSWKRPGTSFGSIPACAGKSLKPQAALSKGGVHPRVCGEACRPPCRRNLRQGPSPRVRGSPTLRASASGIAGSIPACAGKPRPSSRAPMHPRVHPRVCGEALISGGSAHSRMGPSPRVRGSPGQQGLRRAAPGSIPACAGKPGREDPQVDDVRVHPRVCGEAPRVQHNLGPITGPSPRVRGSPTGYDPVCAAAGSIPACAGKPV